MMEDKKTKFVYDTIDFSIAVGQNSFSQAKDLRDGTCKGDKLVLFGNGSNRLQGL